MALRTDPFGMNVHDVTAVHQYHLKPDLDGDAAPSGYLSGKVRSA